MLKNDDSVCCKKKTLSVPGTRFTRMGRKEYFGKLPRYYRRLNLAFVAVYIACFLLLSVLVNRPASVSAVTASGVGVYWDSDLSKGVSSINWGTLTPGSKKSIAVYVHNEGEEPAYLSLWTTDWDPSEASGYLNLGWDYSGQQISPGKNLRISLTLSASRNIQGISSFSFDIIITASDSLPADINDDGSVNLLDALTLATAFGSKLGDNNWNPDADISPPYGTVDILDVIAFAQHFGETYP